MKILVTGGLGNVGWATLQELAARHHEVTCLDIPTEKNRKRAKNMPGIHMHWGDITDDRVVTDAVSGQDIIVHLAAILPPTSNESPERAQAVNVGGTRNILNAAARQERLPKLLFSSSFDLFGPTQNQTPPRKVTDPIVGTDPYSRQKIECETMIKASGLTWSIFRFADVPPMESRKPHPIMFRIPLNQRFEVVHPDDVGFAIASGLETEEIWGNTWLIGGGKSCQITYQDYFLVAMRQAGLGKTMKFPVEAFSREDYCTDWLDSTPAQELLHFQRHTFAEIMADVERTAPNTITKMALIIARPLVLRWLLSLSPYYKKGTRKQTLAS